MSHCCFIIFMINGSQVYICFQYSKSRYYLSDGVILVCFNNSEFKIKVKTLYQGFFHQNF
jgi:hypothetical protein